MKFPTSPIPVVKQKWILYADAVSNIEGSVSVVLFEPEDLMAKLHLKF